MLIIAERLHLSIRDVEKMSVSEYNEWVAYFKIVNEKVTK